MVVDAQEPSEPNTFIIDTNKAKPPQHMVRMIGKSTKKTFEYIYEDNAESMAGLVDEEHESADEHAEEVFEYLRAQCNEGNKFKPGEVHLVFDAYISICCA